MQHSTLELGTTSLYPSYLVVSQCLTERVLVRLRRRARRGRGGAQQKGGLVARQARVGGAEGGDRRVGVVAVGSGLASVRRGLCFVRKNAGRAKENRKTKREHDETTKRRHHSTHRAQPSGDRLPERREGEIGTGTGSGGGIAGAALRGENAR
jgi:hypothetical protein